MKMENFDEHMSKKTDEWPQQIYVVWREDAYTEKMQECYRREKDANRTANALRKAHPEYKYFVSIEKLY